MLINEKENKIKVIKTFFNEDFKHKNEQVFYNCLIIQFLIAPKCAQDLDLV